MQWQRTDAAIRHLTDAIVLACADAAKNQPEHCEKIFIAIATVSFPADLRRPCQWDLFIYSVVTQCACTSPKLLTTNCTIQQPQLVSPTAGSAK